MLESFELKFNPKTIEHLGVRMYSTLPPALAELISNSYDADSSSVNIKLYEQNGIPKTITVIDDGDGMTADEIQSKFLVIGRNRRDDVGDKPSTKFGRLATGKKGLGKLALFGLANTVTVDSVKDGKRSQFTMQWDLLMSTENNESYKPTIQKIDEKTDKSDGTTIKLSQLKRKSRFDQDGLANSLSRIFIVDNTFNIKIYGSDDEVIPVSNERKYNGLNKQFQWSNKELNISEIKVSVNENGKLVRKMISEIDDFSDFLDVKVQFYSSHKPLTPASGLRGVTLFSRGKLVNAPEYFSDSTSSHFFEYFTGIVEADFIDMLDEDVISTNRQSINWEHPKMEAFREFLSEMIKAVKKSWREERKDAKEKEIGEVAGIDTKKWFATLPKEIRSSAEEIVGDLNLEEGIESSAKIVKALHTIIPEYPHLHWRHLHSKLQGRIEKYYKIKQYGDAADQGVRIYMEEIRNLTGLVSDGAQLTGDAFGNIPPKLAVADTSTETGKNIQKGQEAMSRGVVSGFWNPVHHQPIDSVVPEVFSELDCLNILSLISYLITRLDSAQLSTVKED